MTTDADRLWYRRAAPSIRPGDTVSLDQRGQRQFTVLEGPERLEDLVGGRIYHQFFCRTPEGKEGYMIFRRTDHVWSESDGKESRQP